MTDGRIYTREDELDILDEDLGVLRRRLWNLESAPYEGRACDQEAIEFGAARIREQIRELERTRMGMLCDRVAEAEGFAS